MSGGVDVVTVGRVCFLLFLTTHKRREELRNDLATESSTLCSFPGADGLDPLLVPNPCILTTLVYPRWRWGKVMLADLARGGGKGVGNGSRLVSCKLCGTETVNVEPHRGIPGHH